MQLHVNVSLAERIGLRDSIIATYLWDRTRETSFTTCEEKPWIRAGALTLATLISCFSEDQVRRSLYRLVASRVIRRKRRNEHPYDMTYSYSFTDKGLSLMRVCGEEFGSGNYE